jgi:hypothetical protein
MSKRVNLPPGCSGFDCKDGTKIKADKPGGTVVISDRHADALNRSQFAEQGFISAKGALSFGTKRSMICVHCNRVWNAWNSTCPKCGADTVEQMRPTALDAA